MAHENIVDIIISSLQITSKTTYPPLQIKNVFKNNKHFPEQMFYFGVLEIILLYKPVIMQ